MALAFRYEGKDVATALGQGVDNKIARSETPVTFAYEKGTPIRFAGEELTRNLGINGEFGGMANNKDDPDGQAYLKQFASQWASGPFGPDGAQTGGLA